MTDDRRGLPRRGPRLSVVFVVLVAGGLLIGMLLRDPDSSEVAMHGARAPDFTVDLIDGGHFGLANHIASEQPRAVVVNLWASWCIPCRTEIPAISEFATENPDVSVVGVSVQDSERASRAFAGEIGASYPLALGNEAFEDAYPWLGLPATYVLDGSGRVKVIHNGIVTKADLEEMTEGL